MATGRVRANDGPLSHRPAVPDVEPVVEDEDWYGRDLTGQSRTRYSFVDTDWTETVTEGTVFDECAFSRVRSNASRHTASAFTDCTFHRCTFFDTVFTDRKLVGSLCRQSEFTLLAAHGGDRSFVGLPGAKPRQATFDRVRMREVGLTAADLAKANVTGCDLSGSMMHSSKLTGADPRGSDLPCLDPLTAELSGATIDPAQATVIATALGCHVLRADARTPAKGSAVRWIA